MDECEIIIKLSAMRISSKAWGGAFVSVPMLFLSGGVLWWFFQAEDDPIITVMAAVLVGRLAACGGRPAAGLFSGGGRASYSVSRQLARVNGLVRGKPPPPRPPSGPTSNPVATAVVRFGGKGWDFILELCTEYCCTMTFFHLNVNRLCYARRRWYESRP